LSRFWYIQIAADWCDVGVVEAVFRSVEPLVWCASLEVDKADGSARPGQAMAA